MHTEEITCNFGKPSSDPAIEAMFDSFGIKSRPELQRLAKSPYEAIVRIKSKGMLFSFSERNYWENLPITSHGKSRILIFTNLALSAGISGLLSRYEGNIPFNLLWEDSRTEARKKMASLGFESSLHAYKRDAWWLENYRVRLTYQPGDINRPDKPGLFDVSLGIPMPISPPSLPLRSYPTSEEVFSLFGKSATNPLFHRVFDDFEPKQLEIDAEQEIVDRKREYGFALYFDTKLRLADGSPTFVGINMCRDRMGDSTPWRGELPFALHFDDSPAVLEYKIGKKADHWDDFMMWGVARWFIPGLLVWINFDNFDNCIESIRVLREGYRNDLRT
ncbi:hypothetical protein [Pseudomonas khavaziana]|uniref:hypothetical protein n=1 Tax=Pseudomonas khavaziana TaxID=2842351 RepID=UPI001C3C536A|nr:hypothetical protein [Pseudomonas khavaziana]MBV4481519.1 hypothetical protein [Pseudomonas khavaziana]